MTKGRASFAAGLAAWAGWAAAQLPADYMDLSYLLSLDSGRPAAAAWVHPLWLPLLRAWRAVWRAFGWDGPMLVPIEGLNVALGAACACVAYLLAESLSGDAALSALAALLLAFSPGFAAGCARPTPYAAAALAAAVSIALWVEPRRRPARARWLASGLAAGAAAGLHLSALALVPAAALAARDEPGGRPARLWGRWLAGFAAALGASYALFMLAYGARPPSGLFRGVEQIPGTSLWSDPSPLAHAGVLLRELVHQGGGLFLAACAAAAAARSKGAPSGAGGRAARAAAYAAAGFSAFFYLNNDQNGFVFAAFLGAPAAVAVTAAWHRRLRPAFLAAGCAALALSAAVAAHDVWRIGRRSDAIYGESRFLREALGPGGLLLVPGKPFPELAYEPGLRAVEASSDRPEEAAALAASVRGRGGVVLFDPGRLLPDRDPLSGAKERQVFEPRYAEPGRQARETAALLARLPTRGTVRSPRGWTYWRLADPE